MRSSLIIYTEKRAGQRTANTAVLFGSLTLQLQQSLWHPEDLTQPKCCDRWTHTVPVGTPVTCCLLCYLHTAFQLNLTPEERMILSLTKYFPLQALVFPVGGD